LFPLVILAGDRQATDVLHLRDHLTDECQETRYRTVVRT